jgi:uncharacterized protein
VNALIADHQEEIRRLCREHSVIRLDVFGSAVSSAFTGDSDVDFLVVFKRSEETNAFHQYFDFKEALSRLLNREVDLVCYEAIRNPFFKQEVDSTRHPVYAA